MIKVCTIHTIKILEVYNPCFGHYSMCHKALRVSKMKIKFWLQIGVKDSDEEYDRTVQSLEN